MPIGLSKFLLGRWKSTGGGTCLWVAEPGCAQSGTAGVSPAGDCPNSDTDTNATNTHTLKDLKAFIAQNSTRVGAGAVSPISFPWFLVPLVPRSLVPCLSLVPSALSFTLDLPCNIALGTRYERWFCIFLSRSGTAW